MSNQSDSDSNDMSAADAESSGAAAVETPASELPAADEVVTALQKERDELYDRLLRATAEFDNYRKRVEKERREMLEFAAADVLADLLPIIDDLERALAAPAGGDAEAYRKGVEIIYRQMQDLLKRHNVTALDTLGSDFDPHVHQAVIHEVSDAHREGEVMAELRRGYKKGERLLRPAMVKVAKTS